MTSDFSLSDNRGAPVTQDVRGAATKAPDASARRMSIRLLAPVAVAAKLSPKTPRDVVLLLNREVRAIFSDPEVQRELSRRGMGPRVTGSPEELDGFVRAEIKRWGPIVQRAGVALSQ